MLCKYLKLDIIKEEKRLFAVKSKKVDYQTLIKFCENHSLEINLNFKDNEVTVFFKPLVLNILSDEEIAKEEDLGKIEESDDMLNEIQKESEDLSELDDFDM